MGASGVDMGRNAFLSIFTCPSTAKGGKISTIGPLVSHADHSEHSVQVIITEHGVADLRGKSPVDRARLVIENCAHAEYRGLLRDYAAMAGKGHSPHTRGDMRAAKYKQLHADSNPGVRDLLTKYHMHNFSIYLQQIEGKWYEFGYYEYTGKDFEGDMARLAKEPRNIDWLKVCDPMQLPLPGAKG